MRTKKENKIIEAAIQKGIEYIQDEKNDVSQAIHDYIYPCFASDDAQSYWTIEDKKRTRQGNHAAIPKNGDFELRTFVYAHGVFEDFTGRTMRLIIKLTKSYNKISDADFFWKTVTNL